jgi:type VI secretion system protein VasG
MLPDISRAFLTKMIAGEQVAKVQVAVEDGEFSYGFA